MISSAYLYDIVSLISGTILFMLAVLLAVLPIRKEPILNDYRKARKLLCISFFIIDACIITRALFPSIETSQTDHATTLIIASLQAMLFTYTLSTLIFHSAEYTKNLLLQTLCISSAGGILIVLSLLCSTDAFMIIMIGYGITYIGQLIFYFVKFHKKYRERIKKIDTYYSEFEDIRLRWVAFYFNGSEIVALLALAASLMSGTIYTIFIITFTIYYSFFFQMFAFYLYRYGNFIFIENEQIESDEDKDLEKESLEDIQSRKEEELGKELKIWIKSKMYLNTNQTEADIAYELKTNRSFLSNYIKEHYDMDFRQWRTRLRLEESKDLLLKYPSMPVSKIAEQVSIADRSNFTNMFRAYTQMTPKEWRTRNATHHESANHK